MRGSTPIPLTPANPQANSLDDDPAILARKDGSILLVWLSNRGGGEDLWASQSFDKGASWSEPSQVTRGAPDRSWYPSLVEVKGLVHLIFSRADTEGRLNILHNASRDGITWNPANEIAVTSGPDDRMPTAAIIQGRLLVYFDSRKRAGGITRRLFVTEIGSIPKPLHLDNQAHDDENDQAPHVIESKAGAILAFVRHKGSPTEFFGFFDPSADILIGAGRNGLQWRGIRNITKNNITDTLPQLYLDSRKKAVLDFLRAGSGILEAKMGEIPKPVNPPGNFDLWSPRLARLGGEKYIRVFASAGNPICGQIYQ